MSDSTAPNRPLSGAEEFDRRIRSIGQTPSDAMAELARLVGQQDPFRPGAGGLRPAQPAAAAFQAIAYDDACHEGVDPGEEPGAPAEPAVVHAPLPEPQAWERAIPRFPSISLREERAIEQTPDVWARGAEDEREDGYDAPALVATREAGAVEPSSAGRTLVVLAAVIVLTGGGLAASFLAKPSASVAIASETPTILAATGPSKVQPETPAAGDDAPSEPSKLLDKNKNDGTAEAKVVNTVEQPVDLAQAIKPAPAEVAEAPAAPPSPFPEPRKVKTILVRPDGSIITDSVPAMAATLPITAANQEASLAFDARTVLPPVTHDQPTATVVPPPAEAASVDAAPKAVTPPGKTTARVPPAKPVASTAAEGSAAAQARSNVATPKIRPVAHVAAKPKPVAVAPVVVADATPTADTPGAAATAASIPAERAGGSFAIQLGAAMSEAEGQAAASKLGQQYADAFGGAKPSVHKAQAGGKTVYRIRVGNLSQDDAKALCTKVQASGGGCFVAR